MSSRTRLLLGLSLAVLLLLLAMALWLFVWRQDATSETAGEARPEPPVEALLLGLALTSESTPVSVDTPLFLQVDLRARPTAEGRPPPMATFGSEPDPWWTGLRVTLDPGAGNERSLAFDTLQPRDPVEIDLSRESAFLDLAIAPDTLSAGDHTLGARFESAGEVLARSDEIELVVEAAASPLDRAMLLARYHLELDRPEEALASLDSIPESEATEPDFYALRGDALEMRGDWLGAIEAYSRAIAMVAESGEEALEPPTYYLQRRRQLMGRGMPREEP